MLDDLKRRKIKFQVAHGAHRHGHADRPSHVADDWPPGRA
jgi:hypothetical protein